MGEGVVHERGWAPSAWKTVERREAYRGCSELDREGATERRSSTSGVRQMLVGEMQSRGACCACRRGWNGRDICGDVIMGMRSWVYAGRDGAVALGGRAAEGRKCGSRDAGVLGVTTRRMQLREEQGVKGAVPLCSRS